MARSLREEIFLDMKAIVPDSNPNTRHFLTKKIISKIEKRIDEIDKMRNKVENSFQTPKFKEPSLTKNLESNTHYYFKGYRDTLDKVKKMLK